MSKINQTINPANGEIDNKTRGSIKFKSNLLGESDIFVTDEGTIRSIFGELNDQTSKDTDKKIQDTYDQIQKDLQKVITDASNSMTNNIDQMKQSMETHVEEEINKATQTLTSSINNAKTQAIDEATKNSKDYTDQALTNLHNEISKETADSITSSIKTTIEPMVDDKIKEGTKDLALKSDVSTEIKDAVSKSEEKINKSLEDTYNSLDKRLQDTSKTMVKVQSDISSNKDAIAELTTKVDNNTTSIQSLETEVNKNKTNISTLQNDLSTLEGNVNTLKSTTEDNLKKGLQAVGNHIASEMSKASTETDGKITTAINTIHTTITNEVEGKLTTLKGEVTTEITDAVTKASEANKNYAEQIGSHLDNLITTANTKISSNEQKLANVQSELERLQGALVLIPGKLTQTAEELQALSEDDRKAILDKHVTDSGKNTVELNYCVNTADDESYVYRPSGWKLHVDKPIAIATDTTAGVVLSDPNTEGNVSVDANGTMTVVGYSTLKANVEKNTADLKQGLVDAKEYTNDREAALKIEIIKTNKFLENLEDDKVDANTTEISNLKNKTDLTNQEVNTLKGNLSTLEGTVGTNETNINALSDNFTKLDKFIKDAKVKVEDFYNSEYLPLERKVEANKQEVITNLKNLASKVEGDITTAIDSAKQEVESVLEGSIRQSAANTEQNATDYSNYIFTKANEYTDKAIKSLGANSSTEVDEKIRKASEAIHNDYTTIITELKNTTAANDNKIKTELEDKIDNDIQSALTSATAERDKLLGQLETRLKTEYTKDIADAGKAVYDKAIEYTDNVKNTLEGSISNLSGSLDAFKNTTNNSITNVDGKIASLTTKVNEDINNLTLTYNELSTLIGDQGTDFDNKLTQTKSDLTKGYEAADERVLSQSKTYTDESIAKVNESATKENSKLQGSIDANKQNISTLGDKVEKVGQYLDNKISTLQGSVSANEASIQSNQESITKLDSKLDTEIKAAKDESNRNITTAYNNIVGVINARETTLNENIKTAYTAGTKYTDTKLSAVNTKLGTLEALAQSNETAIGKINQTLQHREGSLVYITTVNETADAIEAKKDKESFLTQKVLDSKRPKPEDMYAIRTSDDSTYYFMNGKWHLKRLYVVSQATNDNLGIVKGSTAEGYGNIQGDGSIKVVGFDVLKQSVEDNFNNAKAYADEKKNEAITDANRNTETKVGDLKSLLEPKVTKNTNDITSANNVINDLKSKVVTKEDDQTVTGNKTFTGDVTITYNPTSDNTILKFKGNNDRSTETGILVENEGMSGKMHVGRELGAESFAVIAEDKLLTLKSQEIGTNVSSSIFIYEDSIEFMPYKNLCIGNDQTNEVRLCPNRSCDGDVYIRLGGKNPQNGLSKLIFDFENQHVFENAPDPTEDYHFVTLRYLNANVTGKRYVAPLVSGNDSIELKYDTANFKVDGNGKLTLREDDGILHGHAEKLKKLETGLRTKVEDGTALMLSKSEEQVVNGPVNFNEPLSVGDAQSHSHAVNVKTLSEALLQYGKLDANQEYKGDKTFIGKNDLIIRMKPGENGTIAKLLFADREGNELAYLGKVENSNKIKLISRVDDIEMEANNKSIVLRAYNVAVNAQGNFKVTGTTTLSGVLKLGQGSSDIKIVPDAGIKNITFSTDGSNYANIDLQNRSGLTGIKDPVNDRDATPKGWVSKQVETAKKSVVVTKPLVNTDGNISLTLRQDGGLKVNGNALELDMGQGVLKQKLDSIANDISNLKTNYTDLNNAAVKITGNQSIEGDKVFKGVTTIEGELIYKSDKFMDFQGSNGNSVGKLGKLDPNTNDMRVTSQGPGHLRLESDQKIVITTTGNNGNIDLNPHGSGKVWINGACSIGGGLSLFRSSELPINKFAGDYIFRCNLDNYPADGNKLVDFLRVHKAGEQAHIRVNYTKNSFDALEIWSKDRKTRISGLPASTTNDQEAISYEQFRTQGIRKGTENVHASGQEPIIRGEGDVLAKFVSSVDKASYLEFLKSENGQNNQLVKTRFAVIGKPSNKGADLAINTYAGAKIKIASDNALELGSGNNNNIVITPNGSGSVNVNGKLNLNGEVALNKPIETTLGNYNSEWMVRANLDSVTGTGAKHTDFFRIHRAGLQGCIRVNYTKDSFDNLEIWASNGKLKITGLPSTTTTDSAPISFEQFRTQAIRINTVNEYDDNQVPVLVGRGNTALRIKAKDGNQQAALEVKDSNNNVIGRLGKLNTGSMDFIVSSESSGWLKLNSNNTIEVNTKNNGNVDIKPHGNGKVNVYAPLVCKGSYIQGKCDVRLGDGGGVVTITPEDNSTKTIKFSNNSIGTRNQFNIDLENKVEINNVKKPTSPKQVASKEYVDDAINTNILAHPHLRPTFLPRGTVVDVNTNIDNGMIVFVV